MAQERILALREYLATSEFDLLFLYTEFRASPAGHDVPRDEFLRLPLQTLYEVIRYAGDREKRMANIHSISTARLSGIILSIAKSFSGGKGTDPDMDQLLPFPLSQESNATIVETREILKDLIARRKLPVSVIATLHKVITA